MSNNPITRKQAYRSMLIHKCPRLCVADGVVSAERERSSRDAGWVKAGPSSRLQTSIFPARSPFP